MEVIIIDGSPQGSGCWLYSRQIVGRRTTVKNTNKNIGHGPGMVMGIELCKTEYFLLVDSDVVINKAEIIEEMVCFSKRHSKYGTGQVIFINDKGMNFEPGEFHLAIPYIHPHFALINKLEYLKYSPIINHGAPLILAMQSLKRANIEINEFDVWRWVTHKERGTREQNPKHFHPKYWDQI
jgi:glycosyltransferase involved in cell wall biosynthesis